MPPTGRHRLTSPAAGRARRLARSPLGVAAIVVGLVLVLALAVPLGLRYTGCGQTHYLRISAAQSIAPVLREAATEFNSQRPRYSGDCVFAQVDEIAPHRVMTELAGGTTGSTIAPHVWVPESSVWVELTRISETGARNIETDPPSLASSPVVLAAPRDAEGLPPSGEAGWGLLLPGGRDPDRPLVMVDPNRGADGMTAMHAVRRELGRGDDADTAMTDFVRDVQLDTAFGEIDLASFFSAGSGPGERGYPLVVAPEQAVVEFNLGRRDPAPPLEARYPVEGTVSLDYPYVTATDDADLRAAAGDLLDVVQSAPHRQRLRDLGFREPDGTASAALRGRPGIDTAVPAVHEDLTGDALLASVTDWNRLSMHSRTLVLADTSASMAEDLDGGPSRLEVARQAALLGLSLFPDETDLGLWLLSTEFGADGRQESAELAPLGTPDEGDDVTRRRELIGIAEDIEVQGGRSRLYDNILASYSQILSAYEEDKINSVIVLTAGRDEGSSEISHGELVAALQDRFDPQRPVTMFIIAFGEQPERAELQEIAAATSGSLFVTDDPAEIGDIFLSSISRRLCVPDCDN